MSNKLKAVCFGEILFDVFLKNKKIGGAPLNVASRLKSFGIDVSIISAVGNDNNGKELIEYFIYTIQQFLCGKIKRCGTETKKQ